jgi:hypothetical protein
LILIGFNMNGDSFALLGNITICGRVVGSIGKGSVNIGL